MLSLTSRLLLALSVVLGAFLSLTGYALDSAFQESARAAVRDRLQGYALTLVAATEIDADGTFELAQPLPITRLNQRDSGLYARIESNGRAVWVSPSTGAILIPAGVSVARTEIEFRLIEPDIGDPLFSLTYGVSWDVPDSARVYAVQVAENLETYNSEVSRFRGKLIGWLASIAIVLLAVQGLVLRWSLAPLRLAAAEIKAIESGAQQQIRGQYPKELRALTDNLNEFIKVGRERLERYRNSLSDLAHSLKTPLALMRGAAEGGETEQLGALVNEQVTRMGQIVDYQLQRAATSGRTPLASIVAVDVIANKLRATLDKVYAEKKITCICEMATADVFHGDESDMYELLGNLLENAYKWCKHKVRVSATLPQQGQFSLTVEDDGPGVEPGLIDRVFERGISADKSGGTGIGLAIVNDIVKAYGGSLTVGTSPLGGAAFTVILLH